VPIIGAFSYTLSALPAGMEIGRYCSIARGVTVAGAAAPDREVVLLLVHV
jgi:hypothetical protein